MFMITKRVRHVIISDVSFRVHHTKRFQLEFCLQSTTLVNLEEHVARTILARDTKRRITDTFHHRLEIDLADIVQGFGDSLEFDDMRSSVVTIRVRLGTRGHKLGDVTSFLEFIGEIP